MSGQWLTVAEVAAEINRPPAWIRKQGRAGWVPMRDLPGRSQRIALKDLPTWKHYDRIIRGWEYASLLTAPGRGYVYFAQARGHPRSPIKIGHSVDPRQRVAGLETGSPYPLVVRATLPGGLDLEHQLHLRFNWWRLHHEWFAHDAYGLRELIASARKVGAPA